MDEFNEADFDARMTARDPRYPARKAACEAFNSYVTNWIDEYEWTDGENGYYSPNEHELSLIHDAVAGLMAESEYELLQAAWRSLCGHGDPVAAAKALHGSVLGIVGELIKADPHSDTSAGRVLDELSKAVEAYEKATLPPPFGSAGTPGVQNTEGTGRG